MFVVVVKRNKNETFN